MRGRRQSPCWLLAEPGGLAARGHEQLLKKADRAEMAAAEPALAPPRHNQDTVKQNKCHHCCAVMARRQCAPSTHYRSHSIDLTIDPTIDLTTSGAEYDRGTIGTASGLIKATATGEAECRCYEMSFLAEARC